MDPNKSDGGDPGDAGPDASEEAGKGGNGGKGGSGGKPSAGKGGSEPMAGMSGGNGGAGSGGAGSGGAGSGGAGSGGAGNGGMGGIHSECRPSVPGGTCNLMSSCGCSDDKACYVTDVTEAKATVSCQSPGRLNPNSVCDDDVQCVKGYGCVGGKTAECRKYCESDKDCGANSICETVTSTVNQQSKDIEGYRVCFETCEAAADCSTKCCVAHNSGVKVCAAADYCVSPPTPACTSDANCTGGDRCLGGRYCTPPSCTTDQSCGMSSGFQNRCFVGSSTSWCMPGCATNQDCSAYPLTACRTLDTGLSCIPILVGLPCENVQQCGSSWTCVGAPGGWCSPPQCTTDADCGNVRTGVPNRCTTNSAGKKLCFPGCTSNDDCKGYPNSTCNTSAGLCSK
ncbi:MAG TPA: hypothetical protein VJV78_29915 [Polyangiales bacterium]|nr:hypothetical protein [Polyangiales bacterium]